MAPCIASIAPPAAAAARVRAAVSSTSTTTPARACRTSSTTAKSSKGPPIQNVRLRLRPAPALLGAGGAREIFPGTAAAAAAPFGTHARRRSCFSAPRASSSSSSAGGAVPPPRPRPSTSTPLPAEELREETQHEHFEKGASPLLPPLGGGPPAKAFKGAKRAVVAMLAMAAFVFTFLLPAAIKAAWSSAGLAFASRLSEPIRLLLADQRVRAALEAATDACAAAVVTLTQWANSNVVTLTQWASNHGALVQSGLWAAAMAHLVLTPALSKVSRAAFSAAARALALAATRRVLHYQSTFQLNLSRFVTEKRTTGTPPSQAPNSSQHKECFR